LLHSIAAGANKPGGKSIDGGDEFRIILPGPVLRSGGKPKMGDTEWSLETRLTNHENPLGEFGGVGGVSTTIPEPAIETSCHDRDTSLKNMKGSGAERGDKLRTSNLV
jgi:hypothetical protein